MNKRIIIVLVVALLPQIVKAECAYSEPPSIQEMTYMEQEELEQLHCKAKVFYDMAMSSRGRWHEICLTVRDAYDYDSTVPDSEIDACANYAKAVKNADDCERVIENSRRVLRKDYGVEEIQCAD